MFGFEIIIIIIIIIISNESGEQNNEGLKKSEMRACDTFPISQD